MVNCVVVGCRSRNGPTIRFFRFPRDPVRRKVWALNVSRAHWTPSDGDRLCQRHFDNDQYESKRLDGRRLLKNSAVPTIFTLHQDSWQPPHHPSPHRQLPSTHTLSQARNFLSGMQKMYGKTHHFTGHSRLPRNTSSQPAQSPAFPVSPQGPRVPPGSGIQPLLSERASPVESPSARLTSSSFCLTPPLSQPKPNSAELSSLVLGGSVGDEALCSPRVRGDHGDGRFPSGVKEEPPDFKGAPVPNIKQEMKRVRARAPPGTDASRPSVRIKEELVDPSLSPDMAEDAGNATFPFKVKEEPDDTLSLDSTYSQQPNGGLAGQNHSDAQAAEQIVVSVSPAAFLENPAVARLQRELEELRGRLWERQRRYASLTTNLAAIFTPDQVAALACYSTRGRKWSPDTVQRAVWVRQVCGAKGYHHLIKEGFPLPSQRTLTRNVDNSVQQTQNKLV